MAAILGGEVRRLARGIDAEDLLEQQQRADDADDGHGIRDGVGERGQRETVGRDVRQRAERLRARAERRRVRRGAGEDPEHRRRIEAGQPAGERRARGAEDHDGRREHVQFHALLPQRREEAGAELQADGEDKQDQPELFHEIERVMIDRLAEVPDEDAREEHARRAEADAAEFQTPERHPEHAHESEHADGVRDGLRFVELEEPAHPSSCRRCGLHLGARAGGVGLEVLVEQAGELLRGGVVGGFVGPGVARDEDFRRHVRALGDDVEAEDGIALASSPSRARRRGSRR